MSTAIQRNTLIHGDCLHILPQLAAGSVNFILTDPPYITHYQSRDGRRAPNDDNDTWLQPVFSAMYRVLAHDSFGVSFYGWSHADRFCGRIARPGFGWLGISSFPSITPRLRNFFAISTSARTYSSKIT